MLWKTKSMQGLPNSAHRELAQVEILDFQNLGLPQLKKGLQLGWFRLGHSKY